MFGFKNIGLGSWSRFIDRGNIYSVKQSTHSAAPNAYTKNIVSFKLEFMTYLCHVCSNAHCSLTNWHWYWHRQTNTHIAHQFAYANHSIVIFFYKFVCNRIRSRPHCIQWAFTKIIMNRGFTYYYHLPFIYWTLELWLRWFE